MTVFAFLALAFAQQGQASWKPLDSVRAFGRERYADGPARPVEVSRSRGQTAFTTSGGLQGSLMGTERREVNGAKGVFTWLTASSKFALWLPAASTAHYPSFIQPVRFSKSDLVSNRAGIEKSLGISIVRSSKDRRNGRDCFILTVADKTQPSTHQEIWIDKETGIVLKRRDWHGTTDEYELTIDKFDPAPPLDAAAFSPPAGSTVVKGVVDPELLLSTSETKRRLATDLAEVAVEIGARAWLRSCPSPEGFDYISTVFRKRGASSAAPKIGSALGAPEMQPGGLPPGWSVNGQVDPANGAIDVRFTTPAGPGARAIILGPRPGGEGSSFGISISRDDGSDPINLEFVSYVAPDGALVIAPGKSAKEAEEARQRSRRAIGNQGVLVQTDFLDRKTGDTVSFIQSRAVDVPTRLRGFSARKAETKQVDGLGETRFYEASAPYPLKLISWTSGDVEYLLASTRLSHDALQSIALRTTPLARGTRE